MASCKEALLFSNPYWRLRKLTISDFKQSLARSLGTATQVTLNKIFPILNLLNFKDKTKLMEAKDQSLKSMNYHKITKYLINPIHKVKIRILHLLNIHLQLELII